MQLLRQRLDSFDACQRVVVGVLGDHHVRKQAGACVAARQQRGLCPDGANRACAGTVFPAVLRPRVLQQLQRRGGVLQRP